VFRSGETILRFHVAPYKGQAPFPARCSGAKSSQYCLLLLFQAKGHDVGIVGDDKDLAQRHNRLAEMHPVGEGFAAGSELLAALGVMGIEHHVAHRR